MNDIKLAVDKLSPISWWSVLISNILVTSSFGAGFSGVLLLVHSFRAGLSLPWFILSLGLILTSFFTFIPWLVSNSEIRKLRYSGTMELPNRDNWGSNIPRWAFVSRETRNQIVELLDAVISEKVESSKKAVELLFLLGWDNDESRYRVKLVHECLGASECEKPAMHLFGYEEKRDGEIYWARSI